MPFRIPSLVHYGSLLLAGFAVDIVRYASRYHLSARVLGIAGSAYGLIQGLAYYLPVRWWVDLRYPEIIIPWSDTALVIIFGTLGGAIGFLLPYGWLELMKSVRPVKYERQFPLSAPGAKSGVP